MEKYGRSRQATDDIICHMCFACWVAKVTDMPLEYVILIAFLWQWWLCKCATLLLYMYIACLVLFYIHCCCWTRQCCRLLSTFIVSGWPQFVSSCIYNLFTCILHSLWPYRWRQHVLSHWFTNITTWFHGPQDCSMSTVLFGVASFHIFPFIWLAPLKLYRGFCWQGPTSLG